MLKRELTNQWQARDGTSWSESVLLKVKELFIIIFYFKSEIMGGNYMNAFPVQSLGEKSKCCLQLSARHNKLMFAWD